MNAQIRLAERQGLLSGAHLSKVQVSAVFVRLLQENREKDDARSLALKTAMLSTGMMTHAELFPNEVAAPEPSTDDTGDFLDDDETPVAYRFADPPSENWGPEEAERLLAELTGGNGKMSMSGRDIRDWSD